MKNHFEPEDKPENQCRKLIFTLMISFEKLNATLDQLLNFQIEEKKALDRIEEELIAMEKSHLEMTRQVKKIEEEQTIADELIYRSSPLHEAIRRTYNLLTALNVIDLNNERWVEKTARALIDPIYYRQIKALIYNSS